MKFPTESVIAPEIKAESGSDRMVIVAPGSGKELLSVIRPFSPAPCEKERRGARKRNSINLFNGMIRRMKTANVYLAEDISVKYLKNNGIVCMPFM